MVLFANFKRLFLSTLVVTALLLAQQPLVASAAVPICGNPTMTGTSGVGNTLSASVSCSNSPVTIAYQWLKSATSAGSYALISGATASTFQVTPAEAGMFVKVSVNATNGSGTSATVTSSSATGPHVFIPTPFVGSATAGTADGQGSSAQFTSITGMTSDSNYLYVADSGARLVKRVDSAGNVTTIAGSTGTSVVDGIGTAASFHSPNAIAYNAAQHSLFIKDASVIREMDLTTGQVTTLQNRQSIYSVSRSGTTVTVTFSQPHGLASTVTFAGVGAPYDATFNNVFAASATTVTFTMPNFLNVPVFYPTGATATSDLGDSRTSANSWSSFYEAFELAPDGRLYMGRANAGATHNRQSLVRFTRLSGSVFKYERLVSIGGTPCALGIVSNTEMFIGTCQNINRYTTTDDWATVNSQLTIASPFNTGIIYDHGGFLNFASNQYDATTGVTSTKFHTGSGFDIWEILGTDLFAAQQPFVADTQIFRFTGAASGVRMAGVSAPTYSVNFDANGGSGTMQAQSSSVQAALNANTFSNSGSGFTGWNTAANGSGTAYADQASYPFLASVTLYAQWTSTPSVQQSHTVTFSANGGSGTMQAQSSSVQAALNANTFSNSGSGFTGWNTAANGSGTAYADQASYPFLASVTLYAQWTTNSQVVNTPQVTSDGLVVTSWIRASGIFGSTARLTLRGNELQLVNSAQSSGSNIRIVNQSSNMLELEISEAALGLGWVQLNSPNRTITVQDAFVFSEREANVSSVQKTIDYSVRFAGNSSFISSQTRQRLMSLMQTSSTPLSIVITGSVSSRALTAPDKALALQRAKAVALLASKAFPGMKAQVKISPAKGISALNRSAMIRIELSSKG